jgi:hypothetical protein
LSWLGWISGTLQLVRIDLLEVSMADLGNAAIVHNVYPDKDRYPKMIWATNYFKLAAATMFTLFFAGISILSIGFISINSGSTFAPKLMIDGINIQQYLQSHFLDSVARLAKAIVETPGLSDVVVGYDTLNEPSSGWIGCTDITRIMHEQELKTGLTPSPLQALRLGEGCKVEDVEVWELTALGPQKFGTLAVDPQGVRSWMKGKQCVWEQHGVWDSKTQKSLKANYFSVNQKTGDPLDFLLDFWKPFINSFTEKLRSVHKNCVIFVEPPVGALPPTFYNTDAQGPLAFAPHWYDGLTLLNKTFNSWFTVDYIGFIRGRYTSIAFALKFGMAGIKACFKSQLNMLRVEGQINVGNYPCVFGEIGIPYDMVIHLISGREESVYNGRLFRAD